jgi:hypothetical protein
MGTGEANARTKRIFVAVMACIFSHACTELKSNSPATRDSWFEAGADASAEGDADDLAEAALDDGDADASVADHGDGRDAASEDLTDTSSDIGKTDTRDSQDADATQDENEDASLDADETGAGEDADSGQDTSRAPDDADCGAGDGELDVRVDGDGGPPADACSHDCNEGGTARCASTSQLQVCAEISGCLQWVDVGACPASSLCCGGTCVAADENNCYACEANCSGRTPSCSASRQTCVCTDEACGAHGQTCNVTTGLCDPPPAADYYVDAKAEAGGNGSFLKPFRTITAALAAASLAGGVKSIYVLPGTYDAALGEQFPLVARGVTIRGAGASKTIVSGTGEFDHSAAGGTFNGQYWATFLAGSPELPTTIGDLSVLSDTSGVSSQHYGVFCDRGSASGAVSPPAGLTLIDRATIGPAYHGSIVAATTSTAPVTGCNLRMTASNLLGGWLGVYAVGCGVGVGAVPVVLDIGGDDPASGNVISGMQLPGGGWAVLAQGCVKTGMFRHNLFTESGWGVAIDQRGDTTGSHPFVFRHNKFLHLASAGIGMNGYASETAAVIDEVSDNSFVDVSASVVKATDYLAAGLSVDVSCLGKVRRNQFIGNDVGIWLWVDSTIWRPGDLGTPANQGQNVFRCNSSMASPGGADVIVGNPASGILSLAGNFWDHNPPSIHATAAYPEGADIALSASPAPTVDTTGAGVATVACPAGRATGP